MGFLRTKFVIEEKIKIDLPKKDVWEFLLDKKKKAKWSPWLTIDETTQLQYEGTLGKVGFTEFWDGKIIGKGSQTIEEIKSSSYIKSRLDFIKPFKSTSYAEFELRERKGVTTVIWRTHGSLPFFLAFMKKQMKFFIGEDFKRGLRMLKQLAEKKSLRTSTKYEGIHKLGELHYISYSGKGTMNDMIQNMPKQSGKLFEITGNLKINTKGFFSMYHKVNLMKDQFEYSICLELGKKDYSKLLKLEEKSDWKLGLLSEHKYIKMTHNGSYDFIPNTWTAAYMHLKAEGFKANMKHPSIEWYEKHPHNTKAESKYITHIYVPTTTKKDS